MLGKTNRPRFGTNMILPSTRVDPACFPEEEYPLNCPKCGYLLRGMPEPRCPECGEAYDPGRLLVQQYVLEQIPSRWRLRSQHAQCAALIVLGLSGAWTILCAISRKPISSGNYAWYGYCCLMLLSSLMMALAGWDGYKQLPLRRKRRRVYNAARAAMAQRWQVSKTPVAPDGKEQ